MKKVKWTAWTLIAVLFAGTALSGCRSAEEPEETQTVEAATVAVEDEAILEIGDPTASLNVLLTNKMGSAITGLSVKSPMEKEYPANMMTAGQKLENDGTARLFYEPVTAEDIVSAEGAAVAPDESYVGYWGCSWNEAWELTILSASAEMVTFRLWEYRTMETDDDVTATFDAQHVGTFSTYSDQSFEFAGNITFYADSIVMDITQSNFQYVDPGTIVFDEKNETSQEYGDNGLIEQQETDAAITSESNTVADDTYCHCLQVTMENGDIYELSGFDIEDMEEVTLYLNDGVAYLEYLSLAQNVLISTRDLELQIKADKDAAQTVIDMIAAIGTVTAENAEDHRSEIEAARAAYDALTDAQKGYVTNYGLLQEMERTLNGTDSAAKEGGSSDVDPYEAGYQYALMGYTEDEIKEQNLIVRDEGSIKYNRSFWLGYRDGLVEWDKANGIGTDVAYQWGLSCGERGLSEAEAKAEALAKGLRYTSQYYQDFLNGYNAGLSNSQDQQYPSDDYYEDEGYYEDDFYEDDYYEDDYNEDDYNEDEYTGDAGEDSEGEQY